MGAINFFFSNLFSTTHIAFTGAVILCRDHPSLKLYGLQHLEINFGTYYL